MGQPTGEAVPSVPVDRLIPVRDRIAEDVAGAVYIPRHYHGGPPTDTERAVYHEMVAAAKGPEYERRPRIKRTDLYEYTLNADSRDVVHRWSARRSPRWAA